MLKVGIIIQARSGSIRFPKKIFQLIDNKTILEHVISRVKKTKFKKRIIIATTKKQRDKIIKKIAKKNGCDCFFGSEANVLERFFLTAVKFKLNHIIRICADSPFIDPLIIEQALKLYKRKNYDLISNTKIRTFPKGMSVEIFSFNALKNAIQLAKKNRDKEHVTRIMYQNPKIFKIKNLKNTHKLSKYNFVVDLPKELNYLRKIYFNLKKQNIEDKFCLKNLTQIAKTI